jgi:hypothetical protein
MNYILILAKQVSTLPPSGISLVLFAEPGKYQLTIKVWKKNNATCETQ